jgi:hypothetical protein
MQIVNEKGERLYFTEEQRNALLAAAGKAPREVRSFCSVLLYRSVIQVHLLDLFGGYLGLSESLVHQNWRVNQANSALEDPLPEPTSRRTRETTAHGFEP